MKVGPPPPPLIRVLALLDRSLARLERGLNLWPLAGLLLLTLASILTLTALYRPHATPVLPGVRGGTNIPPSDLAARSDIPQPDNSKSLYLLLTWLKWPGSDFSLTISSSPLNTPPLADEEAHVQ